MVQDAWKTIGTLAGIDASQPDERITLTAGSHPAEARAGHVEPSCGALLRPQTEYDQAFETTIEAQPDQVATGVAAYSDPDHYYALTIEQAPDGPRHALVTARVDDLTSTSTYPLPEHGPVTLRIISHETHYAFEIVAGGEVTAAGRGAARLISAEAAQWFVGTHWTLLALGAGSAGEVTFTNTTVAGAGPAGHASPVPFL